MRLSKHEIESIKHGATAIFGPNTTVRLFGSRTDDSKKGGDIDLYIEPEYDQELQFKKIKFLVHLDLSIGEQKVEVVIARDKNRSIEQLALKEGIIL